VGFGARPPPPPRARGSTAVVSDGPATVGLEAPASPPVVVAPPPPPAPSPAPVAALSLVGLAEGSGAAPVTPARPGSTGGDAIGTGRSRRGTAGVRFQGDVPNGDGDEEAEEGAGAAASPAAAAEPGAGAGAAIGAWRAAAPLLPTAHGLRLAGPLTTGPGTHIALLPAGGADDTALAARGSGAGRASTAESEPLAGLAGSAATLLGWAQPRLTLSWVLDGIELPSVFMNMTNRLQDVRDPNIHAAMDMCRLSKGAGLNTLLATGSPLRDVCEDAAARQTALIVCSHRLLAENAPELPTQADDLRALLQAALRQPRPCHTAVLFELAHTHEAEVQTVAVGVDAAHPASAEAALFFARKMTPDADALLLCTGFSARYVAAAAAAPGGGGAAGLLPPPAGGVLPPLAPGSSSRPLSFRGGSQRLSGAYPGLLLQDGGADTAALLHQPSGVASGIASSGGRGSLALSLASVLRNASDGEMAALKQAVDAALAARGAGVSRGDSGRMRMGAPAADGSPAGGSDEEGEEGGDASTTASGDVRDEADGSDGDTIARGSSGALTPELGTPWRARAGSRAPRRSGSRRSVAADTALALAEAISSFRGARRSRTSTLAGFGLTGALALPPAALAPQHAAAALARRLQAAFPLPVGFHHAVLPLLPFLCALPQLHVAQRQRGQAGAGAGAGAGGGAGVMVARGGGGAGSAARMQLAQLAAAGIAPQHASVLAALLQAAVADASAAAAAAAEASGEAPEAEGEGEEAALLATAEEAAAWPLGRPNTYEMVVDGAAGTLAPSSIPAPLSAGTAYSHASAVMGSPLLSGPHAAGGHAHPVGVTQPQALGRLLRASQARGCPTGPVQLVVLGADVRDYAVDGSHAAPSALAAASGGAAAGDGATTILVAASTSSVDATAGAPRVSLPPAPLGHGRSATAGAPHSVHHGSSASIASAVGSGLHAASMQLRRVRRQSDAAEHALVEHLVACMRACAASRTSVLLVLPPSVPAAAAGAV